MVDPSVRARMSLLVGDLADALGYYMAGNIRQCKWTITEVIRRLTHLLEELDKDA